MKRLFEEGDGEGFEGLPDDDGPGLDDDEDWDGTFDDDGEGLEKFDLGAYAGALR